MNRLRELRKRKSMTQNELADILGVSAMSISRYESGKDGISNKSLVKLSEIFGVSIDYILGNTDADTDAQPEWRDIKVKPVPKFAEETFKVPLVATLRCGYNRAGQRVYDVIQEIDLPPSYRDKYGEDILLIKAIGESMLPTIRPRDLLICKPGDSWTEGVVVAVNVDDSDTIKRIQRAQDGGIDLVPDNPKYREIHFSKSDLQSYPPHILGRVVRNLGQDL